MEKNNKNYLINDSFMILGDLYEQYSFAQNVIHYLEEKFSPVRNQVEANIEPFYIYNPEAKDIKVEVEGLSITLNAKQQGALITYRLASVRDKAEVKNGIFENPKEVFTQDVYENIFLRIDWSISDFYSQFKVVK